MGAFADLVDAKGRMATDITDSVEVTKKKREKNVLCSPQPTTD